MALPTLPTAPSTLDPTTFADRMDAWIAALATWTTAANSLAAGMTAAAAGGAMAANYKFSTTTTEADPTAGYIRLNNATQNAATAIYFDTTSSDGVDWTSAIDLFDDSTSTVKGYLVIRSASDGTKYLIFSLSSMTQPSGYRTANVTCLAYSSATPFAPDDSVVIEFTRTGDKGDKGDPGDPGVLSGNATGAISMVDQQFSRALLKDCANVVVPKGDSGTTLATFDYEAGSKQTITATGNHTFAFSNWPPSGNEGVMHIAFTNYGNYTITPPTVTWKNPDGTETTSLTTHFAALAAAGGRSGFTSNGVTEALFWTDDAGTTVRGKFL